MVRRARGSRRQRRTSRPGSQARSLESDLAATGRVVSRALSVFKGATSLLLNAENKHIDASFDGAASSTPNVMICNALAQGDTNITRDGNSIKALGFELRYAFTMSASALVTFGRIIVLMDVRCQGSAPTVTDIVPSSAVALPEPDEEPNRFVILYDKAVAMTINGANRGIITDTIHLPSVSGVHFTYSGNAGTVADVRGPALYVYYISSEGVNTPTLNLRTRLWFVDN